MTDPRPIPDRFATARSVLVVDRLMGVAIRTGGVGIIAAVSAILLFIAWQVAPLFSGATVREDRRLDAVAATAAGLAAVGLDEWGEHPYVVDRQGRITVFKAGDGTMEASFTLPGPAPAVLHYAARHARFLAGGPDGRLRTAQLAFTPVFADGKRTIKPTLKPGLDLPLMDGPLADVAVGGSEARQIAVGLGADGRIAVVDLVAEETMLGRGNLKPTGTVDLTGLVSGKVRRLLVGDTGTQVVALTADGDAIVLQREDHGWERRQVFRPFADLKDPSIADAAFLLGDVSIAFSSATGAQRLFSLAIPPGGDRRVFVNTKTFDPLPGGATFTAVSLRNKSLLSASGKTLSLRFGTSADIRWERALEFTPLAGAIGAKYDRLAVVGDDGGLHLFSLHDPHPEASLRAFFGKVWYEGASAPKYEWQSTGGTDDFEPKLSLVPLIFGTLKGTIYALLFAIPIGLLAALYTAEFMHPKVKSVIKPTVEIMAAMPSVVLGFLAALWLAPRIEDRVPSIICIVLLVPAVTALLDFIWARLTPSQRSLIRPGWEWVALLPVVAIVGVGAWHLGPAVESLLFTVHHADGTVVADFRQWWPKVMGVPYEQRNSLVVGVMMGFAVIPIIFTITEDSLSNVPRNLRSASLALGASRWQTAWRVVLPTASAGIFSAAMIGLGRAIGETMIVVMATGNTGVMDINLFNGMRTLSANIAVELPEAPVHGTLYRTLFLGALLLFLFTFAVNTVAEVMRTRLREKYKTV